MTVQMAASAHALANQRLCQVHIADDSSSIPIASGSHQIKQGAKCPELSHVFLMLVGTANALQACTSARQLIHD